MPPRRIQRALLLLSFLVLSSCDVPGRVSGPELDPNFAISDGTRDGNPHFFFLPPMASAPAYGGTFDGGLAPVVVITAEGEEPLELPAVPSEDDEHYAVNWHTGNYDLDPSKIYRVTAQVGGFRLGFADVVLVDGGKALRNVNTREYVPLKNGRTLPIKFRIEVGATPASIEVEPEAVEMSTLGETAQLTVSVVNVLGEGMPWVDVSWLSDDEAVASVSTTGLVTAVGDGSTAVHATVAGLTATASVQVQTQLQWRLLAAENSGPSSMGSGGIMAAVHVPADDALIAVRVRRDFQAGELWRLSLEDHQWTRLTADGWPIGKFRQFVYDSDRNEIVTAWDGLGEVWAISASGGQWYPRGGAPNRGTHYIGSFFYDPMNKRLGHLFGYGWYRYRSDYHVLQGGSWSAQSTSGDAVWPRISFPSLPALDAEGRYLYFNGGGGDANPQQQDPEPQYDDLVRFDLTSGTFEYLAPRTHRAGVDRLATAIAFAGDDLYRWGGTIFVSDNMRDYAATPTNELQLFENGAWVDVSTHDRPPPSWHRSYMFYDAVRGDLVVIGGWTGDRWHYATYALKLGS